MKYDLYDLEVTTIGDPKSFNCSHKAGEGFVVEGENFRFLPGTKQFSHYAFAGLVPFLAAKQRANQESDWMLFESDITCTDPQCGATFRIKRTNKRTYDYNPIEQQS